MNETGSRMKEKGREGVNDYGYDSIYTITV